MNKATVDYNKNQTKDWRNICELLAQEINRGLPKAENKIWYGHPVWFIKGNPVVGYDVLKD